jgi:O-antigen ligase
MSNPSFSAAHKAVSRIRDSRVGSWLFAGVLALIGGAAVTRASTVYVAGFLAIAVVAAVFLWRFQEPMVPFVLLVAAMQGGDLLRVSLGSASVTTLMPVLGGWALVAALANRRPSRQLGRPLSGFGHLLKPSLVALGVVVALTGVAQEWRPGGSMLSLAETLTLVQLGVLVALSAYLLTSPRRVLYVGYAIIATCAVLAAAALANRAGLATSWFEVYYSGDYARASGLGGDPNFFSYQLLIGLAFAAHIALAAKRVLSRGLAWSAFALIVAGIVSTYSAGALVGLAAVLAATILLQLKVSVRRALVALCLIAVATAVVASLAPPDYTQAVKAKYAGIASGSFEKLGTGRGAAWEAALREIESNPVLGVGLGPERRVRAIAEYFTYYSVDRKAAHNSYLALAVGAGVFGLAAFLMILASCFSILWTTHSRAAKEGHSDAVRASACVFTGLVVIATQGLQLDLDMEKLTWLLVGASLAIRYWSIEPQPRQDWQVHSETG